MINHVPEVVASGLLIDENGLYRPVPWDGKGIPDVLANSEHVAADCGEEGFSFGVWNKKKFELRTSGSVSHSKIWPYIIIKRCKGDIFAHL